MKQTNISKALSYLNSDLVAEILSASIIQDIPKNTEILREGQYVKVIPIVLQGLYKSPATNKSGI